MTLLVIGASHRTVNVAELSGYARALARLRQRFEAEGDGAVSIPVREIAFLSTCNRVEVYAVAIDGREAEASEALAAEIFGDRPCGGEDPWYEFRGLDAAHHLCRVAAGLDSMVVGEPQIAGQVAKAFREATASVPGNGALASVAELARAASRRVRSETDVGRHSVSIASVALDLVREELGTFEGRRALVVGAGKVGKLVCTILTGARLESLTVMSRTSERASDLAGAVGCSSRPLDALPELLSSSDLVITATDSETSILDRETVVSALGKRDRPEPLYLVDLALSGDVESSVGCMDGVRLLTLTDVQRRLEAHVELRMQSLAPAEEVVDEVVAGFATTSADREIETLITQLRRGAEAVRSREVQRWLESRSALAGPSREELDRLTRSLVNKLLHDPMVRLRAAPALNGDGEGVVRAARELFGVVGEGEGEGLSGQQRG